MVDRFLAVESLRSVTAWLNRSGIPPLRASTGTSGLRHPYTVRSVLSSARISGQRAYAPDTRADPAGGREILGRGDWEAIITPEETAQIRAILADPTRRRTTPARPTHLGGIARCGKCGAGLTITGKLSPTGNTQRYTYQKDASRPERGGLSIHATHLDDYVTERLLHRLANPWPSSDKESTSARLGQLERDRGDRFITRFEYRVARSVAEKALRETERQLIATDHAVALHAAPIGNREALEDWWHAPDVTDRRAVITTLITRLRIAPGKPGATSTRPGCASPTAPNPPPTRGPVWCSRAREKPRCRLRPHRSTSSSPPRRP